MHSATANTPMIAPRSVIVTRAATIQHQDRIRVGFAYLTRKAANCDLHVLHASAHQFRQQRVATSSFGTFCRDAAFGRRLGNLNI